MLKTQLEHRFNGQVIKISPTSTQYINPMDINGQRIREQDLAHPNRRGWVILLYLILHKAPVDQLSMAAELWQTRPKQKFFSMTGIESLTKIARKGSTFLYSNESLPGLRLSRQAFTIFRFKYQDCLLRMFPRTALKTERYFCCSEVRQAIQ